jgi:hypothetical protein
MYSTNIVDNNIILVWTIYNRKIFWLTLPILREFYNIVIDCRDIWLKLNAQFSIYVFNCFKKNVQLDLKIIEILW